MQDIYDGLLLLNDLYYDSSLDEYQKARQDLEEQVKRELPGFTVSHAIEIGTAGAGDAEYHHGGVAHVLCPVLKR